MMKKLITICAVLAGFFSCSAQTVIDNFNVGPYIVDYNGQGDVEYRLRDNIDLYDYFELSRDTTIISRVKEVPVKHAIEIVGNLGANRFASKEIGLSGMWKQLVAKNLYFNGGLSLSFGISRFSGTKRDMFEFGIPLQIEYGKLNHQKASLYGAFGLSPVVYSTIQAENDIQKKDENGKLVYDENLQPVYENAKKSGFMIAPSLDFGGNIPVGSTILRIGVYAKYKINCTPGDFDVYKMSAGRMFLGAKIGVIL